MSTKIWPPISPTALLKEEQATLAAELHWLLDLLRENLSALKSGLEECVALLAPQEPGSTLALSSLRSESVKGYVTRVGTRIVKGEISLRLPTLPPPRQHPQPSHYPLKLTSPLPPLPQLSHLLTLLNQALDIIDISLWTGDPHNGEFISGQLKLLWDTLEEAKATLRGGEDVVRGRWWEDDGLDIGEGDGGEDPSPFMPPLPPFLSPHLSISDAALVLHIRTLAPADPQAPHQHHHNPLSLTGLSLRSRLGLAARPQVHDELDEVFPWRGGKVVVREKVRVESQDPSLMAVGAKLGALGKAVGGWRGRVGIVMGEWS